MTNTLARQRSRRLPVFLLLDTSAAMGGTFQITMQEGVYKLQHELASHPASAQRVYLSSILFNEQAKMQQLTSLSRFVPPTWEAQGIVTLRPALARLVEAFTFDLIQAHPSHPGDHRPLIFLLLGSEPSDMWLETAKKLTTLADDRKPLIIILVTHSEAVSDIQQLSRYVLLLPSHNAIYITQFFNWMLATILTVCNANMSNSESIEFPELPKGIVLSH